MATHPEERPINLPSGKIGSGIRHMSDDVDPEDAAKGKALSGPTAGLAAADSGYTSGYNPAPPQDLGKGEWLVASDVNFRESSSEIEGFTIQRFSTTGEPHLRAHISAARQMLDRPEDMDDALQGKCAQFQTTGEKVKVTLLMAGVGEHGASSVMVRQVSLLAGASGPAFLSKGSRKYPYKLDTSRVLAYEDGWGKKSVGSLADKWHDAAGQVPVTEPVTREGLAEIPPYDIENADGNPVHSTFLINHPGFGGGGESGCMFFATDYDSENGIANGYFWAPDGQLESEYTSMYDGFHEGQKGLTLSRIGGRVANSAMDGRSLQDCFDLPGTRSDAYAIVNGVAPPSGEG